MTNNNNYAEGFKYGLKGLPLPPYADSSFISGYQAGKRAAAIPWYSNNSPKRT